MIDLKKALQAAMDPGQEFPPTLREVVGFSGPGLRSLVHHVCAAQVSPRYLEVGVFFGATFGMAMWQKSGIFIGVDNFSEFSPRQAKLYRQDGSGLIETGAKNQRESIVAVMHQWGKGQSLFFEMEHLSLDPLHVKNLTGGLNVFFYDGNHSATATEEGIYHYAMAFADELVVIFDDYNVEDVRLGVQAGLRRIPFETVDEVAADMGGTAIMVKNLKRKGLA